MVTKTRTRVLDHFVSGVVSFFHVQTCCSMQLKGGVDSLKWVSVLNVEVRLYVTCQSLDWIVVYSKDLESFIFVVCEILILRGHVSDSMLCIDHN